MTGGPGVAILWVAGAAVAFVIGSVNPATIFARLLHKDLSATGSGNPGATNAGRVLGLRWGVVVAVLDILKGFVPTYMALRAFGEVPAYVIGVAAVLGHVFSPFLRGRGGKGVATALGGVLGVRPWFGLAMLVVFGLVLAASRWFAAASLASTAALVVLGVLAGTGVVDGTWATTSWTVALAGIVAARHQGNVRGWVRARRRRP